MKCKLLFGLFGLVCAQMAWAQPGEFYENNGSVLCPPEIPPNIDAINFVNRGYFIINFTNEPPMWNPPATVPPFETQNTLHYTNANGAFMSCNQGFRMETFNQQTGRRPAATLFNAGTINCGTAETTNLFFGGVRFLAKATNIVSPGAVNMGYQSLFSLEGGSVNLTRGSVNMEQTGYSSISGFTFFSAGILDGYWGTGTNIINPAFEFETLPPWTPLHGVTNRNYQRFFQRLIQTNGLAYVSDLTVGSNRTVRAVFLKNTNSAFNVNVYFPIGATAVEWSWLGADAAGMPTNQNLYLFDYFGYYTNFYVVPNGVAGSRLTFIPWNYSFYSLQGQPLSLGQPALPSQPLGVFNSFTTTNQYSAYQALFEPTSVLVSDVAGQSITNLPGRVEIKADTTLNLSRSRISSLNYLLLKSTNHFEGSSGARIVSPFSDIHLRSTNGLLTVTNLLVPTLPRPEGRVDVWSGRWTNVIAGITNTYHVLFVDSHLAPISVGRIQDLTLRSTNTAGGDDSSLLISDVLNVTRDFLLEAKRITITTNGPGSPTATGEIHLHSGNILWSPATPRLEYLTNYGTITSVNTIFFGGSRASPYYSSTYNEPYQAFVNRGGVTNFGSLIWAKDFENTGTFHSSLGSVELKQNVNATLTNGAFVAAYNSIGIESGTLFISNHVLRAGHKLSLAATNGLSDGGVAAGNFWTAGDGFDLLVKPAAGDLLGTTVTNTAPQFAEVINRWAGEDRRCSNDGFTNNAALGRLILVGGHDSSFRFTGVGVSNALYVDYLEFQNYTTNRNALGDFIGVEIDSNMKIYFAQAVMNGESIAEKLDGRNGGRFCWVREYAGFYSSTNLVYADGSTNAFNAALVASCNLDSDGDGLVNCQDPEPIFVPSQYQLTASLTNVPADSLVLTWQTLGGASNSVWATADLVAPAWQWVTGFTAGSFQGPSVMVQYVTPRAGAPSRFYRVRVETDYSQ